MADNILSREDWQRILEALSHFLHNRDFRETFERVDRMLRDLEPD